ncbi:hypothetical protein [Clostridium brassicae]|uniref:DUF3899 domain-containing protein n=1 Tax=Clostridium brassicae TaxID=2999072 RepID=A0ABT4D8B3_9CLOT|nr:hypothetical protein [Clostridium brassicae]MCY6957274.1 hypothetical protein [Clostridium brassicae]
MGNSLVYVAIILIIIGIIMCFKGDSSLFSPPSGGGSRIPPDAQVRLNESVQKITGNKNDYSEYYHNNNVIQGNKIGIACLIIGVLLFIIVAFQ